MTSGNQEVSWEVNVRISMKSSVVSVIQNEEELITTINLEAYYAADKLRQFLLEKGLFNHAQEIQEVREESRTEEGDEERTCDLHGG